MDCSVIPMLRPEREEVTIRNGRLEMWTDSSLDILELWYLLQCDETHIDASLQCALNYCQYCLEGADLLEF